VSTYIYDGILQQIQLLTPDEQLQLLADIAAMLRQQVTAEPQHSIMELKGLGKEVWEGIDVEKYIDEERNSWDG
jgi:hypothetical protein